ncbi:MAG: 30S ribosomal protein S6 [Deltaproteobacteria bacterium]|jgi:small subunit ribosomal protein S6|nr:30S ribosomal protein S6 [Deltaproteobacteria bacterium]
MRYYETLYIINPDLTDDEYRDVVAKMNTLVEKEKGVITKVEEWGKRTLAYEVKKFDKGSYVLLQYCGESGIVEQVKREMTLDDRVLKYQTIKLSDNADPEALKSAEEGDKKGSGEEEKTTEDDSRTADEGENGIQ